LDEYFDEDETHENLQRFYKHVVSLKRLVHLQKNDLMKLRKHAKDV